MTHVVLVHGAWAGGWVWDGIAPLLRAAGHQPHVVELPGVGEWDHHDVTVDDLAAHVLDLVRVLDGPAVLVGHSGGGVVVTQAAEVATTTSAAASATATATAAAASPPVLGVAIVAGMMLPPGADFSDVCADVGLGPDVGINEWVVPTTDGRGTVVPPEAAAAVFFHGAPADAAIGAARRLRPQLESARLIAPEWTPTGFGSLPRLYIECELDRSVPIEAQRHMQRLVPGAQVVTLVADHAPQLSATARLGEALAEFAHEVGAEPGHGDGREPDHAARYPGLTDT